MTCTYLSHREIDDYKKVQDKDLNELFQEVQMEFDNRYLIREQQIEEKSFFGKPRKRTLYMLYSVLSLPEVQIFNFPIEHDADWSINMLVPRQMIMTYFYGLLNGKNNN